MKNLALLLVLVGVAIGQESATHNGNWWRTLPSNMRLAYVAGYLDGGCHQEEAALAALHPLTEEQRKNIPRCTFPSETRYGQIIDAVDQFYNAANNRLIWVEDAFDCVKADINGKPLPQKEIERMRRTAVEVAASTAK